MKYGRLHYTSVADRYFLGFIAATDLVLDFLYAGSLHWTIDVTVLEEQS